MLPIPGIASNNPMLLAAVSEWLAESRMPLPVGSEVSIEFALPDRPYEQIRAKGKVCWVRSKPDRFTLYPGMGIQFIDIEQKAREHLMELVQSLIQVRQARSVAQ